MENKFLEFYREGMEIFGQFLHNERIIGTERKLRATFPRRPRR